MGGHGKTPMTSFGVMKMTNETTPFEILYNPSVDSFAQAASKFAAIDILYNCPHCRSERVFTWLFPDEEASYVDTCCNIRVRFQPMEANA